MGRIVKFVALALAVSMATLPMSAAIVCLMHSSSAHASHPGCLRMQSHPVSMEESISVAAGTRPCCQLSQAPPLLKRTEAKDDLWRSAHATPLVTFIEGPGLRVAQHAFTTTAASPPNSPQLAALCFFLI